MLLMGTKIGMTRVYTEDEQSIPVTAIQVGPCYVTQIRTPDADGYAAVQIGFGQMKPRNQTIPMIGHDAKAGVAPQRVHREFRVDESQLENYTLGQELGAKDLEGLLFVDVTGRSKGKGFQGGMKRHNFRGQEASHGVERKHRSPGSIGGHANNAGMSGKIKKGKRMAGRMGDARVTTRSLDLVRIVPDQSLVLVKGPVPGSNGGVVEIRPATRLYKGKAAKAKAAAG
jgi:large subunit ribosomal protein L3